MVVASRARPASVRSGSIRRPRPSHAVPKPGAPASAAKRTRVLSSQDGLSHAPKVPGCGGMPLSPDGQAGDAPVAEGEPEVQVDGAAGEVAFEVVDGGVVLVIGLLGADELDGVRVFAG